MPDPRPIKSELKSHRIVQEEEKPIRWSFLKILREYSTLKQFYPEINPYVEVYKFRDNFYCMFQESMDGAGDLWMYLIDGPEKAMLVDTGFGVGDLKGLVRRLVGDKELIVANTHHHFDHAYGNAQFDVCYCHEYELPLIQRTINPHIWDYLFDEEGRCRFTEFDRNDLIPFKEYKAVGIPDGYCFDLGGGYLVEAVLLPGHTPGQCAYLDHHNHILIQGDTTGIGRRDVPYGEYCSVEALRDALVKLQPRFGEIEGCFPGHGMLDVSSVSLQYLLDAAEAILRDPENCDRRRTFGMPSGGGVREVMEKNVYQGSAIKYDLNCVWKHKP